MGDVANGNQTFFIMNSMMGGSVFKDPNNPSAAGVNLLSPQTKATLDLFDEAVVDPRRGERRGREQI